MAIVVNLFVARQVEGSMQVDVFNSPWFIIKQNVGPGRSKNRIVSMYKYRYISLVNSHFSG